MSSILHLIIFYSSLYSYVFPTPPPSEGVGGRFFGGGRGEALISHVPLFANYLATA